MRPPVVAGSLFLGVGVAVGGGPPRNRPPCPAALSAAVFWAADIAGSMLAIIAARFSRPCSASIAPHLTRASTVPLFRIAPPLPPEPVDEGERESTRSQKSWREEKGIEASRDRGIKGEAPETGTCVDSSSP